MKAAQLIAARTFTIVETDIPSLKNAPNDSVLVHVNRACVCGSDMPFYLDHPGGYPAPLGHSLHECIGTVADSKSPRFKAGDRVLAVPGGQLGAAEYFVTDAERTVHLPNGEFSSEILMSQPLGTVIWAFRKLPNLLHANAVVMGQGPMGLLIDHLLSNLGAKRVIGVDRVPERLAAAERMRATHTIDATRESVFERVRELTGGEMADVVVEAVGHQTETLNLCLPLVRTRGTILAFGVPDADIYPFAFKELFFRNLTLIGSVSPDCQRDYPLAMDMIWQRRLDVRPILTHDLPFEEIQRGFELFVGRKDGAIKVILHFGK